LVDSIGVSSAT